MFEKSPRHEIAHLGHVELRTPEPEASLDFFVRVMGLTENGSDGDSVYLRTWDDYEHHSIKLTASTTSGIGRTGLRASSEEALKRRVAAVDERGLGIGWTDGDAGIGPTYVFRDPDGHEIEMYWETERFQPPEHLRPALKNQAQAYPARGVCVRRLDHVNYLANDSATNGGFICDALGGRGHRADHARHRRRIRAVDELRPEVLRPRLHQRPHRLQRPPAPHRLRHRHP